MISSTPLIWPKICLTLLRIKASNILSFDILTKPIYEIRNEYLKVNTEIDAFFDKL